jgi:hypothetical protein
VTSLSGRSALAGQLAATALVAALAGAAHHRAAGRRDALPATEDVVYLPSSRALRVGSLGHTELAADLVFLRTTIYFASAFVGTRNYDWLDQHVDTVNALDPDFRTPYLFASRATMYNGLPITNREVEASSHFLEAGLSRFPNDWELAFSLGCNYLFELKSDDPKQKEAWRRIGARWIRRAAIAGGGPPWLNGLATSVMSKQGETEAAIRYLEEAYLTAQDDATREEIRRLLVAKRASAVDGLQRAEEDFHKRWNAAMPYAPPDLFVVIGDPPPGRLDLPSLSADEVLEAEARATAEEAAGGREVAPR